MNAIVLHAEPAMFSESNKRDPELQQALSEFEKTCNGLTPKPVFSRPYDTIPGIYDKEDPKVIERRKAFIEKMGKNWVLHPEYEQPIRHSNHVSTWYPNRTLCYTPPPNAAP